MARLDTRKCFGRYDGAAVVYRDDGDNEDDYGDSDVVADFTDEEEAACELLKGG